MGFNRKEFKVGDIVIYVGNPAYGITYGFKGTPIGLQKVTESRPNPHYGTWEIKVSGHGGHYWDTNVFAAITDITELEKAIYGI